MYVGTSIIILYVVVIYSGGRLGEFGRSCGCDVGVDVGANRAEISCSLGVRRGERKKEKNTVAGKQPGQPETRLHYYRCRIHVGPV